MTIAYIQSFLMVAKYCNITTAARKLFISQSALSRQINAMEAELKIKLFIRDSNNLRLTPAGKSLQKKFSKLISDYKAIVNPKLYLPSEQSVVINMAVLSGHTAGDFVQRFLVAARSNYPQYLIALKEMSYGQIVDGLTSGTVDVAFTMGYDVEGQSGISIKELAVGKMYLCGAALYASLDHFCSRCCLLDFEDELFAIPSPEDSISAYRYFYDLLHNSISDPNTILATDSWKNCFFAESGFAFAFMDSFYGNQNNPNIATFDTEELPTVQYVAAWKSGNDSPAIINCLEMAKEAIKEAAANGGNYAPSED